MSQVDDPFEREEAAQLGNKITMLNEPFVKGHSGVVFSQRIDYNLEPELLQSSSASTLPILVLEAGTKAEPTPAEIEATRRVSDSETTPSSIPRSPTSTTSIPSLTDAGSSSPCSSLFVYLFPNTCPR
ncbi:hypothetical protein BJV78DRAFT_1157685 [Lactifluus subvellereus]|nr:hypothetical protein BJV78DRAFT_1157685 [Lactifluus subvellereus]